MVAIPDVLALDFDGVLCDGMREYFETSRRTHGKAWPGEPVPGEECYAAFRRLRPVIFSGWEMPLLLRAIAARRADEEILDRWEAVRDDTAGTSRPHAEVAAMLTATLDQVRREWITADRTGWLAAHEPYCRIEELRGLVAEAERTVLVTTKEGEFARVILDDWGVRLASVEGKETGSHKCENLRSQIEAYGAAHGRRPRLWFVEDRLETLEHVTRHPDLVDVDLLLATWGYNTPETRNAAGRTGRIRLLELDRFRQGLHEWM